MVLLPTLKFFVLILNNSNSKLKIFNKNIYFNKNISIIFIYKLNFILIWRETKMLNLKKDMTKLKKNKEYSKQIEYKNLTLSLTCGHFF